MYTFLAFLIVILVNQQYVKTARSSSIFVNLTFSNCQHFGIYIWSKIHEQDSKMKHENEMLAKNRVKLVFKV